MLVPGIPLDHDPPLHQTLLMLLLHQKEAEQAP
jgi:hypothetical protein